MRRVLGIILLIVWTLGSTAQAAVTATPVLPQLPKHSHLQLTNANNLTAQTLLACPTDGGKITGLFATSTDTSARDVVIQILNTSTYALTTVTIPIGAGTVAGTPPVNLLSATNFPGLPTDSDGNPYFFCQSGDTLQAAVLVQITSAKFVNIHMVWAGF